MFSRSFYQKFFSIALVTLLLLGLFYGAYQHLGSPSSPTLQRASFVDRHKNLYTFESFHGKPLLVNLWASWCGPCILEMPGLDRLALKMRAQGGDVLAILVEPMIGKAVASFVRGNIKNLVVYHDFKGRVSATLRPSGLPLTVFIDENGHEVFRYPGALNWDGPEAAKLIREHLKIVL